MKTFLLNSKDIERSSFTWNMIGSMLNAFQSVIMLMILTRILNLYEAGVYTLAYASANLFLNIGKYGMRNFQVSDVHHEYTFYDYRNSRIISTIAMFVVSVLYTIFATVQNGYSADKTQVILWMCIFKLVDSVEDVYLGFYHQNNRLDVAGKIMAIRMALMILTYGVCLFIFKNQLTALIISTVTTALVLVYFIAITFPSFKEYAIKGEKSKVWPLLYVCLPLFACAFLSFYIGNAPKYAIDSLLSDELQACYGFIAMPVFVIGLLNNFIFAPMITKMSLQWATGDKRAFRKSMWLQILVVLGITVVCEVGAYILGIPVLSILYNTDLTDYKLELLILLLGGGFLALSGLLGNIMTIIRIQKYQTIGFGIVSVSIFFLATVFVQSYGMLGGALCYLLHMMLLCLIFAIILIFKGSLKN